MDGARKHEAGETESKSLEAEGSTFGSEGVRERAGFEVEIDGELFAIPIVGRE
jgi:hypothetical protein